MSDVLVLLPGMDGTGVLFGPLLEALPVHVEPLVVRYPGDTALSYDALAKSVLAELPSGRPYTLVAESFSGPVALRVAATRPKDLRAVVLCASFARSPVPLPRGMAAAARPTLMRAAPRWLQARVMLGSHSTPALRARLDRALRVVTPDVLAFRARELLREDASDALRECTAPMLYLRATHDRLVSQRSLEHVLKHQPDTAVVDIDGPHLLLQAQPRACWRAIAAFLDGIAA